MEVSHISKLEKEIISILHENKLEYYNFDVVFCLKNAVEKMVIKILQTSVYYKNSQRESLNVDDIRLSVTLEADNENHSKPLNIEHLLDTAYSYNCRSLAARISEGLRIPKESLTGCNYQMSRHNKNIFETRNRQLPMDKRMGNYLSFVMPHKQFQTNINTFAIKNMVQNMREIPMKITVKPKFNLQHGKSFGKDA